MAYISFVELQFALRWFAGHAKKLCRLLCCTNTNNEDSSKNPTDIQMVPEIIIESYSGSPTAEFSIETDAESKTEVLSTDSDTDNNTEDLARRPRVKMIRPVVIKED